MSLFLNSSMISMLAWDKMLARALLIKESRFANKLRGENKMKTKKHEITCSIPGGWYGNDPGHLDDYNPKRGNVVVDSKMIVPAITWLKRRAKIEKTQSHNDDGVAITYELR